jgi:hypothetical protein
MDQSDDNRNSKTRFFKNGKLVEGCEMRVEGALVEGALVEGALVEGLAASLQWSGLAGWE